MGTKTPFKDVKDSPVNKRCLGKTTKISPTTSAQTGSRKAKRRLLQFPQSKTNTPGNNPIKTDSVNPLPHSNKHLNSDTQAPTRLNNPNSHTTENTLAVANNNLKSTPTVAIPPTHRTILLTLPVKTNVTLPTDRTTLPNTRKTTGNRRTDRVKVNLPSQSWPTNPATTATLTLPPRDRTLCLALCRREVLGDIQLRWGSLLPVDRRRLRQTRFMGWDQRRFSRWVCRLITRRIVIV